MPESRRTFENGGLPDRARERVTQASQHGGFFTTTFTVAEMAVAKLAGYEPIGQVMGSSTYHMGWRAYLQGWSAAGEMAGISHAHREARRLALGRLEEEAAILGADVVIGTTLASRAVEPSGELEEFTAIGTAVRIRRPTPQPPPERPAITNLTAQQLYKLEQAGYWPLGIAFGNCTWYDQHADCLADGNWNNQQMPKHTACIGNANQNAVERFRAELTALRAAGAVAVDVQRRSHEQHYELNKREHTEFKVDVLLLGTGVVRLKTQTLPRPRLILDLGDRKIDLAQNLAAPSSAPSVTEE